MNVSLFIELEVGFSFAFSKLKEWKIILHLLEERKQSRNPNVSNVASWGIKIIKKFVQLGRWLNDTKDTTGEKLVTEQ